MKKIAALLLLCLICGMAHAQKNKKKKKEAEASATPAPEQVTPPPAKAVFVLKTAKDSASYALGIMQGKRFKANGADTLFDLEILQQAMLTALKGDSVSMSDEQMQQAVNSYVEAEQTKKAEANLKVGAAFLAANKNKEGVKTTASGLQYQVIKEGNGAKPVATDVVQVHYTGTLINGKKFDSSLDGGEPAEFPLNGVIPGWTEGIQLMSEGAKYKFFIPAELGYGEQGVPGSGIDGNSVLVFEVELLKIKKNEPEKVTKSTAKPKTTKPIAKPTTQKAKPKK